MKLYNIKTVKIINLIHKTTMKELKIAKMRTLI